MLFVDSDLKENLMNLRQKREAAYKAAQAIIDGASAAGRDLTSSESSETKRLIEEVKEFDGQIARAEEQGKLIEQFSTRGPSTDGEKGFLSLAGSGSKAIASNLAKGMTGTNSRGQKALLPSGESVTTVPILAESPIALGRPAVSLFDALPSVVVPREYGYLRQAVRTNNAAPVEPGDTKPTSIYELERISSHLVVIAHVSEPIDTYWLEDVGSLNRFIETEMVYGLYTALVDQILNGDPATNPKDIRGFAETSGIGVQTFVTDEISTARAAITKAELLSDSETRFFVFHPADWEKIETAAGTGGTYSMTEAGQSLPVERASRRLWGHPVVLSSAVTIGEGWLINSDAAAIAHDAQGVQIAWSTSHADDFIKNQVRARVEGRFDLAVYQPAGVIQLKLTE